MSLPRRARRSSPRRTGWLSSAAKIGRSDCLGWWRTGCWTRYGVTAVVVSRSGDICRGSARGPDGVNLVEALGRKRDRLRYFGGHARAAGFTVAAGDLDAIIATLRSSIRSCGDKHKRDRRQSRRDRCRLPPAVEPCHVELLREDRRAGPVWAGLSGAGIRGQRCTPAAKLGERRGGTQPAVAAARWRAHAECPLGAAWLARRRAPRRA